MASPRCYAFGSASGARLPACAPWVRDGGYARKVVCPPLARDAPPPGSTSMNSHNKQPPKAVGLYDPRFEHDACGVGMVARLDNQPTHEVICKAITALENLEHRGASGADPCTGDGAGILLQMPDELLRAVVDFELPRMGEYGVLMCFLPRDDGARARLEALLERTVLAEGQRVLGWRD